MSADQAESGELSDELLGRIREKVGDGSVTCARAFQIADELNIPRPQMGRALNTLKIKLKQCQLGCFG